MRGLVRILLDNCLPADLAAHIRGDEVKTAVEMGWDGLDDGPLLDAVEGQFDVLITADKSLPFQQQLSSRSFAIVILRAKSNRVGHLARLIPELHRILKAIGPGEVREIF